ncbi:T-box transcription factor TBX15-like [Lycorma delicatula]|uniref:T-box transcription factor TBX15-like n=1 Tax=Lycorma delicatula TaxID=130591 RepID=UPI003F5173FF
MSALSEKARAFLVDAILGVQQEKTFLKSDEGSGSDSNEVKPCSVEDANFSVLCSSIKVELCCQDLWKKFYSLGTEMIITKAGRRRMFPTVKVQLSGLNENIKYMIFMDIIPVDDKRYRYIYHSSQWIPSGNGDASNSRIYIHPDSPASGQLWMTQGGLITFDKLKLTNNQDPVVHGQISLHSMHKYIPRIHVIPNWNHNVYEVKPHHLTECITFTFPETSFITVTAYQNQQITKLKIACNPFAKGFRETTRQNRLCGEKQTEEKRKEFYSSDLFLRNISQQISHETNHITKKTTTSDRDFCDYLGVRNVYENVIILNQQSPNELTKNFPTAYAASGKYILKHTSELSSKIYCNEHYNVNGNQYVYDNDISIV